MKKRKVIKKVGAGMMRNLKIVKLANKFFQGWFNNKKAIILYSPRM